MATVTDYPSAMQDLQDEFVDRKAEQLVLNVLDRHIMPKQLVWRERPPQAADNVPLALLLSRGQFDWLVDRGIIVRRRNCCRAGSKPYLRR